jgi:hypothetical protein
MFALCVSLLDDTPMGSYTEGKFYKVRTDNGNKFTIVDDKGDYQVCWWDGHDPDCVWEKHSDVKDNAFLKSLRKKRG